MAPSEHDGLEMIRLAPAGGETPPELSTGNADDDELLRQLAARTSLGLPRSWEHFLLVPDQDTAGIAARPLMATGWEVSIAPPGAEDPAWCVIAERKAVVLTRELVRSSRELFETIASHLPGAEYDGWQASIDGDEYLQAPKAPAADAPDE
jgi:hypothetical protein